MNNALAISIAVLALVAALAYVRRMSRPDPAAALETCVRHHPANPKERA